MLTTRYPVEFPYACQELDALFRYVHPHDVEQCDYWGVVTAIAGGERLLYHMRVFLNGAN